MYDEFKDKFVDECGVFGIYYNHPAQATDAASAAFYGLYALQHRGQESAGIAVANGHHIELKKGMGLVPEVIQRADINLLKGNIAVGHVRYSTTGESSPINAQPLVFNYLKGMVALAHNGNLTNTTELRKQLATYGSVFQSTTDTEVIANLLARYSQDDLEDALGKCMIDMKGAFALVIMTKDQLVGVRDQLGRRPLCLGNLQGNYVLASESAALDAIGAVFVRDVAPGEIVVIDHNGIRSLQVFNSSCTAHCIFEYIYFARPDSTIDGINVYWARRELGKQLAREKRIEADLVISVPDSGNPAAIGYAEEARLPYEEGLIKNRYVGRTFIQPTQQLRELGVKIKLNANKNVVAGKRVIMVDDSIVRGTTSKQIVNMLREAGAKEVHLIISSPPTKYPCYYGIDTSCSEELIANAMDIEDIRTYIGADTLQYLSLEGMYKALQRSGECFCTSCFSGKYTTGTDRE
jgi:amidophosphoribosyltransferase